MFFFFFNDTATTEIYTLSLHDALPICYYGGRSRSQSWLSRLRSALPAPTNGRSCCKMLDKLCSLGSALPNRDRKSTRLNSSHSQISYAVFCLKKKNHSLLDTLPLITLD